MQHRSSSQEPVLWSVQVSQDTDLALRRFLGEQDNQPGDLSGFVEEAVRARVFQLTVQHIKARNAGSNAAELQAIIDDTVLDVRRQRASSLA